MTRYYCDYCDTYLTHDSVSLWQEHLHAMGTTATRLLTAWPPTPCTICGPGALLNPLSFVPHAACGAKAAQHRLQTQGDGLSPPPDLGVPYSSLLAACQPDRVQPIAL